MAKQTEAQKKKSAKAWAVETNVSEKEAYEYLYGKEPTKKRAAATKKKRVQPKVKSFYKGQYVALGDNATEVESRVAKADKAAGSMFMTVPKRTTQATANKILRSSRVPRITPRQRRLR